MDIGKAIAVMLDGNAVKRPHWDDKTIAILVPGENSKMTEPYIYEYHRDNDKAVPWCPSHQELLATDWEEA